jgi:hypothetical protein
MPELIESTGIDVVPELGVGELAIKGDDQPSVRMPLERLLLDVGEVRAVARASSSGRW